MRVLLALLCSNVVSCNVGFHVRNAHQGRYDFSSFGPEFASSYLIKNKYNINEDTIDWKNEAAVKALNTALLKCQYNVQDWNVPDGYLVPPIPSRADYVHHMADLVLLHSSHIKDKPIVGLDIGCGANCVYSLIATSAYPNWRMIAVDIDPRAVEAAKKNAMRNRPDGQIVVCTQPNPKHFFRGVISSSSSSSASSQQPETTGKEAKELIAFTMCNPPFASSQAGADAGTKRKLANLALAAKASSTRRPKTTTIERNFAGQSNELWCPGGELEFVKGMIAESAYFADRVVWFSSLVSKEANIAPLQKMLATTTTTTKRGVADVRIVEMQHGNKKSRILAWTYF